MVGVLRQLAERTPDAICFRFLTKAESTEVISAAALDRRASSIAQDLIARGAHGERVLLVAQPGFDYIAALFGCMYAGAVAVPAYPPRLGQALARLSGLVRQCKPVVALASEPLSDRMRSELEAHSPASALQWVVIDTIDQGESARRVDPDLTDPNALAVLQYTSGSTSEPKGVMLSQAHFIANVDALIARGAGSQSDHVVSWLPPFHDMGLVGGIFLPLRLGISATLMAPQTFVQQPLRWLAAIERSEGTISGCPNFGYELCVRRTTPEQRASLNLGSWRIAFTGAERVRSETLTRFSQAFNVAGFRSRAFCPCYGLAEATVAVTFTSPDTEPIVQRFDVHALQTGIAKPVDEGGTELVGCGRAIDNTRLFVMSPDTRKFLPDGCIGEVVVDGPGVTAGYFESLRVKEQTVASPCQSSSPQSLLHTGDLGFLLQGELFVTGRKKDLIIIRGLKFHPDDIERSVSECHESLRLGNCAAFSVDLDAEECLVIVHELDPAILEQAELATHIRAAVLLDHELHVHDVVFIRTGTIPRTSSGKVQHQRCRQAYLANELVRLRRKEERKHEPPPNGSRDLVEQIAQRMAELLEVERVEPGDDFFLLGGHSLLATQLVSRLCADLGIDLPLRSVFDASTPRALAAYSKTVQIRGSVATIQPIARDDRMQLSFSQERMWFLHQLDPKSSAYNVAGAVTINGHIDVALLQQALDFVLVRHEVLRSNFEGVEGVPRVVIREHLTIPIASVDLSGDRDPLETARGLGCQLAQRYFDVATDPLLRIALFQLGPTSHLLVVCMHHLVTDAWAMGVFAEELLGAYDGLLQGRLPVAGATRLGYVDFAEYQRQIFDGGALSREQEYWQEKLENARSLELPTDLPRTMPQVTDGGLESFEISPRSRADLQEFARSKGLTPFMVLLTAFELLLYRYSGEDDLVVGVPIANRNYMASEPLMGTLVNTLALRVRVDSSLTCSELLRQVAAVCIDAYANQNLPFERLVSALAIERVPGRSPLVQVMFDYQNTPMKIKGKGGLSIKPCALNRGASQFDLSLLIADTELGQTCGIEYNKALYEAETIARLATRFLTILREIIENADRVITDIPWLDQEDQAQILRHSKRTCTNRCSSLHVTERLRHWATRAPTAPAVFDAQGSLDYAALEGRVRVASEHLVERGLQAGQRVLVCVGRTRNLLVAVLAVLAAGAAYVPVDPRYPSDRIRYIVEDSCASMILTERTLRESIFARTASPIVCIDEMDWSAVGSREFAPPAKEAPAYLIYTSGSTGRPKGVEISLGALANFLEAMLESPGLSSDDRVFSVTTIAFDISVLELFLPLVVGAAVYVASTDTAADATKLQRSMLDFQPTLMQATPSTWRMLIDSGWNGAANLRVLSGGEPLDCDLANALIERVATVWNMYGPTETTVWSTMHRVTRAAGKVPIGRPILNTSVYVLDPSQSLLPRGVTGEIWIAGAGLANGYFKQPKLTDERFVPDPFSDQAGTRMYRTGDLGKWRADGNLECLGRADNQVKIRGCRIELSEIESVLKEQNQLREVLVVAHEFSASDTRLVVYCVPKNMNSFDTVNALGRLKTFLPEYMIPSACVVVSSLPRTPNGKINRAELPAPVPSATLLEDEFLAPRDELERQLSMIWSELLGIDKISLRHSFFSLGGHSLLAVRLLARVNRLFQVEFSVVDLLRHSTLELMAARLRVLRDSNGKKVAPSEMTWRHLVLVRDGGRRSPLFCVHGAGGSALTFFEIGGHLRVDRPVYGLQARGIDGCALPHASIKDMALEYLNEIRNVQARGPYFLVGYCGGGIIALEMSARLREMGETVQFLGLLDTYRPDIRIPRQPLRSWLRTWETGSMLAVLRRVGRGLTRRLADWTRVFQIAYARARKVAIPVELRDHYMTGHFLKTVEHYHASPYEGALVIFRANDVSSALSLAAPDLGWSGYAVGGLHIVNTPGDHESIVHEPNVSILSAELSRYINKADMPDAALPGREPMAT